MTNINHKIKILYVITKSNWGGAQRYIYDLVTNLSSEIFDVAVLHGGNGLFGKKLDEKKIRRMKINNLDRNIEYFNEIKTFIKLMKIFIKEKPDVIHLNSSKIGGLGSFAGRLTGVKKIIFTAHGFAFNEDRSSFQKILIKIITYVTILLSHKTIVISKKEFNQVKNWPFVSKKIILIYNGVSNPDVLPRDKARDFLLSKIDNHVSEYFEDPKDILWVGTISELTKNKGLKYAVDAIYELKKSLHTEWDGIFLIIGDGEDRDSLEKLICEKELEKNVYLTGFVDNAKKYIRAFDIFLLSSIKEGFPYALLEAGQSYNAVISTRVGGVEEIIDDMQNGMLVHPKRPKEIMNAIRYFMANEEKIDIFGEKLKEKVTKEFSIEKMLEKTKYIYNEI